MSDFAWIYNPDTGGVALQPRAAFDDVWSKKGFVLVDLDMAEAAEAVEFPVTEPRQLTEDYVRSVASRPAPSPTLVESRDDSLRGSSPKAAPPRRSTPAKEA